MSRTTSARFLILAVASLLVTTMCANGLDAGKTFADVAQKAVRPAGAPKLGDVCFSSRWRHPMNPNDPLDSFQSAQDFHATGFYWVYADSPKTDVPWMAEIRQRGYSFQGALNSKLADEVGGTTTEKGRIMDAKGAFMTAVWMKGWKNAWWGCVNSPDYRRIFLEFAKYYIDNGAASLHVDDQAMGARLKGACYCDHCKAKAARLGKKPAGIQQESVEEFYRELRPQIDAYAGRHVPMSCNGDTGFATPLFDFAISELDDNRAGSWRIHEAVRATTLNNRALLYTLRSANVMANRLSIATLYASGGQLLVPWDVYMTGGKPRYFGRPAEYADLFGFVRAIRNDLENYADAGVVIPGHKDDRYDVEPIAIQGGTGNVAIFVRAVPDNRDAPVVIHCVDENPTPAPFKLLLTPDRFFGDKPVVVELLTPAPYDKPMHDAAEASKSYGDLCVHQKLASGRVTEVEVPALKPWGIIRVSLEPSAK